MDFIKKNGAGLLLCLCIAIPAWLLGQAVPVVGGPVFSILIGMVLTLFWKNKTKVQPGIGLAGTAQNRAVLPGGPDARPCRSGGSPPIS